MNKEPDYLVIHIDDIHQKAEFTHTMMDILNLTHSVADTHVAHLVKFGYLHFQMVDMSGRPLSYEKYQHILIQFRDKGFNVAIATSDIINNIMSTIFIIRMLYKLAQTNDGICHLITSCLSQNNRLDLLMRWDPQIHHDLVTKLHDLYLTLMADQSFKINMAKSYAQNYFIFGQLFETGVGSTENSIWSLSVQFLNRYIFVYEVATQYNFLQVLCESLDHMLTAGLEQKILVNNLISTADGTDTSSATYILSTRRYNVILGDMKVCYKNILCHCYI